MLQQLRGGWGEDVPLRKNKIFDFFPQSIIIHFLPNDFTILLNYVVGWQSQSPINPNLNGVNATIIQLYSINLSIENKQNSILDLIIFLLCV